MAAPKGNQFWKLRSKHGRDALFASPELLWEAACEYFEWCDEHPWNSTKTTSSDKGEFSEVKPTQRPYSRSGFFLYVGCSDNWLQEFKKNCSIDFLGVISQIENCIDTQQWEGATVGAFNANIIARTLGLKERVDNTTNDESLNKPNLSNLSDDELRNLAELQRKSGVGKA
jgi:hypothetical protein